MATRKSPQQIKQDILDFLFEGPQSTADIAEKIKSNWPTTNKYLEGLKTESKVEEILSTDKMKVFRRTDDPVYYSLPFDKETRTKTLYILKEIVKKWKEDRPGEELSKTALQKIAVDIIKSCNINLPVLNFHYGLTTCASFDESNAEINKFIEEPKEKKIILECIEKEVNDRQNHTGKAYQERENQYKKYKEEMKFYGSKENFMKRFILIKDKNEIREKIKEDLLGLSMNFPIKLQDFYEEFENFISNAQIILSRKEKIPDEKLEEDLRVIKETLIQLWDKITTFTSFLDSERFIDRKRKPLFEQIKKINLSFKELNYKSYFEELESFAQSINPFDLEMPMDEDSKEIQRLILEGLQEE
jgi:hypothetical protein